MKDIIKLIKRFSLNPTLQSLVLALTATYLMFGVLNAGFIMVQVLTNLIDFFFHHLPSDWSIVYVWDRTIILS